MGWVSEYAALAYATPDSAVTYRNHAQIVRNRLLCDVRLQPKVVKTGPVRTECRLVTV